jgi:hypothetical protein
MEFIYTKSKITDIPDKEYVLQYRHNRKLGYRCISWSPHNIMTEWVKSKKQALLDADKAIEKYYAKNP